MAAEVSNDIVAGFEDGTVRLLQYGKSTTNMRPVFSFIFTRWRYEIERQSAIVCEASICKPFEALALFFSKLFDLMASVSQLLNNLQTCLWSLLGHQIKRFSYLTSKKKVSARLDLFKQLEVLLILSGEMIILYSLGVPIIQAKVIHTKRKSVKEVED